MVSLAACLVSSAIVLTPALDDPAVRVRVESPGRALEQVLRLFEGTRASDPATALANWKRATKGREGLGKGPEAIIAAMNPSMVRELQTLDGARFVLDFAPDDGATSWSFTVPKDDGTFAAAATAMALTDGHAEAPLDGAEVDRLGNRPDASLMARAGETVVIANSRDALAVALSRKDGRRETRPATGKLEVVISASGLARSPRPLVRGIGEAMLGLDTPNPTADVVFVAGGLRGLMVGPRLGTGAVATIDPAWLSQVPASASAAFSIAIDGRDESWNRVFAALERVERADPANQGRTPLRPRIGLTARLAGVDLERDVWPKLRGLTGFVVGAAADPEGIALAVHVSDDSSAATLRDRVLPQVAKTLRLAQAADDNLPPGAKPLGRVRSRTVWAVVPPNLPRTVWIGWGVRGRPADWHEDRPAKLIESIPAGDRDQIKALSRWGWALPGRLGLAPKGSPLADALSACGPALWQGRDDPAGAKDTFSWDGLDRGVRRFLELVPQEPAK